MFDNLGLVKRQYANRLQADAVTTGTWVRDTMQALEVLNKLAGYKYLKANTNLSDAEIAHRIRTRVGTPNLMDGGSMRRVYNNLYLFSNAQIMGNRAAIEAFTESKADYTWKTFKYEILPKLVMMAAAYGFLGPWLKEMFDKIPDHDKKNRICIPMWETENGECVYMVMPHSFVGGAIAQIMWNAMYDKDNFLPDTVEQIVPFTRAQKNPILELLSDVGTYALLRQNPVDSWRNQPIIDEDIFKVGGMPAWWELAKHEWNTLGHTLGLPLGKANTVKEVHRGLAKALDVPLLGPAIKRVIRVSKSGETQKGYKARGEGSKEDARIHVQRETIIARELNRLKADASEEQLEAAKDRAIEAMDKKGVGYTRGNYFDSAWKAKAAVRFGKLSERLYGRASANEKRALEEAGIERDDEPGSQANDQSNLWY